METYKQQDITTQNDLKVNFIIKNKDRKMNKTQYVTLLHKTIEILLLK